jgi:hypothetical protein
MRFLTQYRVPSFPYTHEGIRPRVGVVLEIGEPFGVAPPADRTFLRGIAYPRLWQRTPGAAYCFKFKYDFLIRGVGWIELVDNLC